MKYFKAAILLGAGLAAAPTYAAEAPFSGPRIGVEAGWGRVGGGARSSSDGFVYGANLGYDLAAGAVRIGPEFEISNSTQKTCATQVVAGTQTNDCQRSDRDLYAGFQVGYVASPKVMLFAKGGYTNGRFSKKLASSTATQANYSAHDRSGYRLGGGAEYAVTPHVYLTGEYRYSRWNDHIHQNQILGGVGYRF